MSLTNSAEEPHLNADYHSNYSTLDIRVRAVRAVVDSGMMIGDVAQATPFNMILSRRKFLF